MMAYNIDGLYVCQERRRVLLFADTGLLDVSYGNLYGDDLGNRLWVFAHVL
jgi:hypothetical protein